MLKIIRYSYNVKAAMAELKECTVNSSLWRDAFNYVLNFRGIDRKVRKATQIERKVGQEGHDGILDGQVQKHM